MSTWAELFAKEEVVGFRVVSRAPLETEVRSSGGAWVLYFPMPFSHVITAKGGRMAGVVDRKDLVILEVVPPLQCGL